MEKLNFLSYLFENNYEGEILQYSNFYAFANSDKLIEKKS